MPVDQPLIALSATALSLLSAADFRTLHDQALADVYAEWLPRATGVDEVFGELISEMDIFIKRGGKRMRPYLCYLGYVGSGGTNVDEIIRVAVSQELYHNAWLIHDDIIDRDTTRYGGPNITGTYIGKLHDRSAKDVRHLAEAAALIAGSVNMAFAVHSILGSDFAPESKVAATLLQQELIVELAGGEMLDVFLPTLDASTLTTERLIAVSQYKTATYSFQAPLQIGAILAGAETYAVESLLPFATAAGIAFQLTDDVLGIFGHDEKTGKSNLSDIREGKCTLLMSETLSRAEPTDAAELKRILGDTHAIQDDLETVRTIMERSGGHAATERVIHAYVTKALDALRNSSLRADVKASLHGLVSGLLGRES